MDLRCFIAIELSESLKKNIDARTKSLRETDADVKWVPWENLHLTMKFLGKTPEKLVPDIKERLLKAVSPHEKFHIRFYGAGVFPDIRRPRVVWIGILDSDRLIRLQQDIEASMVALGYDTESRPYTPHLTIGRLRSPKGKDALLRELEKFKEVGFDDMEVRSVSVMKSELKPTGARYFRLCDIPLGHP
jgi:2'-5' RNA ligase